MTRTLVGTPDPDPEPPPQPNWTWSWNNYSSSSSTSYVVWMAPAGESAKPSSSS